MSNCDCGGFVSIRYSFCFMKTGPVAWYLHGGTKETSRDGGNQGVDAGDTLPLHLSFWLMDLNKFCNRVECEL